MFFAFAPSLIVSRRVLCSVIIYGDDSENRRMFNISFANAGVFVNFREEIRLGRLKPAIFDRFVLAKIG